MLKRTQGTESEIYLEIKLVEFFEPQNKTILWPVRLLAFCFSFEDEK